MSHTTHSKIIQIIQCADADYIICLDDMFILISENI